MDILEGNKLIAEFMGVRKEGEYYHLPEHGLMVRQYIEDESADYVDIFPIEELSYHVRWDWLMQVVENIEDLVIDKKLYSVEIRNGECTIVWEDGNGRSGVRYYRESNSKITAVWLAVIAFIEWYDQQSK